MTLHPYSKANLLQTGVKPHLLRGAWHSLCFCVAAFFTFTSSAVIAAIPTIEQLRAGSHDTYVRLVIEMSEDKTPDIVRHVDGFAVFFDGVEPRAETLLASAGPMIARIERSAGTLTAVYIEGVTGSAPMRTFTLPGRSGSGVRLVLDFEPRPYDDMLKQSLADAVMPPENTPVPRVRKIEWTVSERTKRTQTASAAMGEDIMAQAPSPPPPPKDQRPLPPISAILPDMKSRERKLNQLAFYGYVEGEARPYLQSSSDGERPRATGSVAAEISAEWNVAEGHAFKLTGFGRVDAADSQRTHAEVREAKYTGTFGDVQVTAGFDTVFWGTTEAFHLVDIINQIDGVEDIDDEDKRGELMLAGSYITDIGTFSAYAMPLARQRTFPGADGRPNGPLIVDTDQVQYAGGQNEWHLSWAARYSGSFEFLDIGMSYFDGIARDPRFTLGLDDDDLSRAVLIPNYDEIQQVGIDSQITLGPLLLKGEAIKQWNDFQDYTAFIAGFEYTAFGLMGKADVGFLAEYLYDDRGENGPMPFEDDVFVGARVSLNDTADTHILAGAIMDLDGDGHFINVEASTRLGDKWRVSIDARILTQSNEPSAFQPFQDDDFVQVRVQRFF